MQCRSIPPDSWIVFLMRGPHEAQNIIDVRLHSQCLARSARVTARNSSAKPDSGSDETRAKKGRRRIEDRATTIEAGKPWLKLENVTADMVPPPLSRKRKRSGVIPAFT